MVVLTMDPVKRAQVLDLMKEKERIEEEINQCGTVLRNVITVFLIKIFLFC